MRSWFIMNQNLFGTWYAESVKHEDQFSTVLSVLGFYFYPVEVRGNYQPKLGKYISHDKRIERQKFDQCRCYKRIYYSHAI